VVQEVSPTFSQSDGGPRALGRSWLAALVSMVVCGLMFEVFYNACNWYTSLRSDVGTWCYDWEFKIPFIPAMIVPYWTLNLFFIGSFFVCSTLVELKVLRTRIGLAILIACSSFLLFPLTLAFPRPEVDGVYGLLFKALRSFDKPYNLSPSLHVALRTLVWPVYVPRTSGVFNLLLRVWFLLIGISTIFTYQHQVIDVATGWLLAIVCLHLVAQPNPEVDTTIRVRNGRVGIYYALGGASLLVVGSLGWPWGVILIWPAMAALVMALGYFAFGAVIYRKLNGRLAFSSRVLLAPIIAGQWLSIKYYRRQCRDWDKVVPGLWIGRRLNNREARSAVAQGVTGVLDLTAEFSEAESFMAQRYLNIPVLDLTAPTQKQLQRAIKFVEGEVQNGLVYVHCKIGYSRSAAVVGAYLLHTGRAATVDEAIALLRAVRPSIVVRPEARRALADFLAASGTSSGGAISPPGAVAQVS
jgi:predicted protein tyrosine phosphatase